MDDKSTRKRKLPKWMLTLNKGKLADSGDNETSITSHKFGQPDVPDNKLNNAGLGNTSEENDKAGEQNSLSNKNSKFISRNSILYVMSEKELFDIAMETLKEAKRTTTSVDNIDDKINEESFGNDYLINPVASTSTSCKDSLAFPDLLLDKGKNDIEGNLNRKNKPKESATNQHSTSITETEPNVTTFPSDVRLSSMDTLKQGPANKPHRTDTSCNDSLGFPNLLRNKRKNDIEGNLNRKKKPNESATIQNSTSITATEPNVTTFPSDANKPVRTDTNSTHIQCEKILTYLQSGSGVNTKERKRVKVDLSVLDEIFF